MTAQAIEEPRAYIDSLGGLHDARIAKVVVDIDAQTLALTLDDINANFAGMADYQGCRPVVLVFVGVTALFVDADLAEGVRISGVEIVGDPPELTLEVDFSLGGGGVSRGRRSLTASFQALQISELRAST